jgi:hypothetical protein
MHSRNFETFYADDHPHPCELGQSFMPSTSTLDSGDTSFGATPRSHSPNLDRPLTPMSCVSDPVTVSTVSSSRNSSFTSGMDENPECPQGISTACTTPRPNTNAALASDTETETEVLLILNRFVAEGSVGDVWEGYANLPGHSHPVHVAAKLAFTAQCMYSLQHEYYIYKHLGTNPDLPVPTAYGYFQNNPECDAGVPTRVGLLLLSWVDGCSPGPQEIKRFE